MGLLDGKTALIFGVANDHSIAWGIAQALHAEGAEVGFSSVESLIEKRVRPLAEIDRVDLHRAVRRRLRRADRARLRALGRDTRFARHPRPRAGVRAPRGPRGRVRRHLARRVRARARRLGLFARRADARGAAAPPTRVVGHHADLLRGREGRRQLQRHGRRQGRARGVCPLSRGRPRARRRPRECDQRRPRADARRAAGIAGFKGMYRGFADIAPLRANITPEDVGRSGALPRLGPLERGHRRGAVRGRRVQRHGRPVRRLRRGGLARAVSQRSSAAPHARTAAGDREMADVDREVAPAGERRDEGRGFVGLDLPRRPAVDAMEVAVDGGRQDVELLAAVGAVAVAQQAELLEDVERSIDGRGDRPGVDRPAALDELGRPSRGRRSSTRTSMSVRRCGVQRRPRARSRSRTSAPIGVGHGMERSGCGHRAKG